MIGILDSGIGGITALKELMRLLPDESFIYLADEAHRPYGNRSRGEICRYSASALSFFAQNGADAALLACGTASSLALDFCKRSFAFPVYGVTEPAVHAALQATKSKRIAVAATEATVKSESFERLFRRYAPDADIFPLACAPLVTLAEDGALPEQAYSTVCKCLAPICEKKPDTLILGCTHFSILQNVIATYLPHTTLIDSGKEAARVLAAEYVSRKKSDRRRAPRVRIFTTQDTVSFSRRTAELFGEKVRVYRCDPHII